MEKIFFIVLMVLAFDAHCAELVEGDAYRFKVDIESILGIEKEYDLKLLPTSSAPFPLECELSILIKADSHGNQSVRICEQENKYTDYKNISSDLKKLIEDYIGNNDNTIEHRRIFVKNLISGLGHNKDKGVAPLSAGRKSKFEVLDSSGEGYYLINFKKVRKIRSEQCSGCELSTKYVKPGKRYYVKKNIGSTSVEKLVEKSFKGVVSGPLIVPFKYRTGDKSFSGEATIGYYAGWSVDIYKLGISFVPMLSAGLTQVSVVDATGEGTENKSGFTWAAGILLQNWDGINIGIVYGQDRIGDSAWEHEGDGWWSVSMGWEL